MISGYYYLHENGDLIFRRDAPEIESGGFVKQVWPVDTTDRLDAWTLLIEALTNNASTTRVKELAGKWGCNARDLPEFLCRVTKPTTEQKEGIRRFILQILGVEPDAWFDWLAATPKGQKPDFSAMPDCPEEGESNAGNKT